MDLHTKCIKGKINSEMCSKSFNTRSFIVLITVKLINICVSRTAQTTLRMEYYQRECCDYCKIKCLRFFIIFFIHIFLVNIQSPYKREKWKYRSKFQSTLLKQQAKHCFSPLQEAPEMESFQISKTFWDIPTRIRAQQITTL